MISTAAPPKAATPAPSALESFTEQAARGKINWEQFLGVRGLAYAGGLVAFLAVAFFVKYSFDNNLVPPELRVAIGFVAGLGLLAAYSQLNLRPFKPSWLLVR